MRDGYQITSRIIGHSISGAERVEEDFYATDPIAAEYLTQMENLNKRIWEPACGAGHLSKVFLRHGHYVLSTDLVDRGYGQGGVDFLKVNEPYSGDIITNPPYKYAEQFIEHGMSLLSDGNKLCLFLKLQFLEGQRRKELFKKYPPKRVWVSSSRIRCYTNGVFKETSSMLAQAWYVWEKGYEGDTILKWFN